MNRSSLMPPSSGSYSYLLRPPLGISTTQIRRYSVTVAAHATRSVPVSVHLSPRDRKACLAARPRRVPRVPGHVLAAQRGIRILLGDQMAELFETGVVHPRRVQALRMDVGLDGRPDGG